MTINKRLHIASKWDKTRALLRDPQIRAYVPETLRFTAESLLSMLQRHSMVYIKPVSGTYGNGVMKVQRRRGTRRSSYCYHFLDRKRVFRSFEAMLASILRHKWKTPYLVQKGIRLLTHQSRHFDIRVMAQKNNRNQWEATGIIGRVAKAGHIVTNYHSGGKPTDVRKLLQRYLPRKAIPKFENVLCTAGTNAAEALSRSYPRLNMVGADIGVDSNFTPWIIELNTRPDPYIFKHLKDPRVYRKVLSRARSLGRLPTIKKARRPRRSRSYRKGRRV